MFLGLEWYWWIAVAALLALSIPFKVKFAKWWSRRQKEKKKEQYGKWGGMTHDRGKRFGFFLSKG